ncbi:MAG: hypothetical protein ABIH39_03745 [Candidatus Margulisiibacteriota bacterium]
MIDKIKKRCEEEIAWAQANIDEMNNPYNYQEEDKIWLPCWLKAHKEILDIIANNSNQEVSQPSV